MNRVRLKYIADVIAGQSPPSGEVTESNGELPFIQGNAEFGPLTPQPKWACATSTKVAEAGDTLVSVRAPVGDVNMTEQRLGIGRGIAALRAQNSKFSKWIYWAMLSQQNNLAAMSTGSTFAGVSGRDIGELRLCLPSDPERVADFLDHETAEIDEFIADFARLINLTREHTQAHISRLMNHSQQRGDQKKTQLGRVIRINQGQVDPRVLPFSSWPLIAPNHIEPRTGRLREVPSAEAQAAESGKYIVKPGQIVYSKIRPALMKATRVDFSALSSADMYAMDANPRWLSNDYLLEYLLSPLFENYAVTMSDRVAMPKLNRDTLSQAPIALPDLGVQKEIVLAARKSRWKHQVLEEEANIAINLARERRAALISAAVAGQIDVTQKRKPVAAVLEDEVGVRV